MGISIASAMSGGQEREFEEGAAGTNKQTKESNFNTTLFL
jgi:hypothetical protein